MNGRRGFRASLTTMLMSAAMLAATAINVPGVSAQNTVGDGGGSGLDMVDVGMGLATSLQPIIRAVEGGQSINKGSDGRLTFFLMGSDARGSGVSRTDSMMIISVKGSTITAASLPRDTARVPRPASMGGGTFSGKANGILRQLLPGNTLNVAMDKFDTVIENLLQIEIDYHALVWFNGFTTLVDKVDPIMVDSTREILDKKHIDDPFGPHGVYFPKQNNYPLYAWDPLPNKYCNGAWVNDNNPPIDTQYWCHRALPYVRSRKGPDNDDWVRSRRQQEFIADTIKAVGIGELSGLVSTAQASGMGKWVTNFPITVSNATDLYNAVHGAYLGNHVVFKPSLFATRIPGTSGYQLDIPAIRAWAANNLK